MEKRYRVTLSDEERQDLQKLVSVGKGAARKLMRARVLLLADQGDSGPAKSDPESSLWRRAWKRCCNPSPATVSMKESWMVEPKPI